MGAIALVRLAVAPQEGPVPTVRDVDATVGRVASVALGKAVVGRVVVATLPRPSVGLVGATVVAVLVPVGATSVAVHPVVPVGAPPVLVVGRRALGPSVPLRLLSSRAFRAAVGLSAATLRPAVVAAAPAFPSAVGGTATAVCRRVRASTPAPGPVRAPRLPVAATVGGQLASVRVAVPRPRRVGPP